MSFSRLNTGEKTAALSAVLLLIFMFVDWFSPGGPAGGLGAGSGGNAWQTLDLIAPVLTLVAATTLALMALRASGSGWSPPIPPSAAVAVLGGIATLLVLFRLIDPPNLGSIGGIPLDASREVGVFLGLLAALGIAYGGYRAMGEAGSSFAKVADGLATKSPRR